MNEEIGYVTSIHNYLVWINGLPNVKTSEIIISDQGTRALVTAIHEDLVEALLLDDVKIHPKESFKRTLKQLDISAGVHLIGRAINPLGVAIDGRSGFAKMGEATPIDQPPGSIKSREKITGQFSTGVLLVDMLVPLAFGQRELIIGDAHSGKTGFLLDTVINQKDTGVICVYALIGKPINEIKTIIDILRTNKALEYTVVVASSSSERASLVYLNAPVATAIAQYFQRQGKNVLLILDDLGLHAKYYREISLLSGKPPGRESYPGDMFYQHAKLIERAGKFTKEFGGGSITCLPVIETNLDDYSSLMVTNLMGMTDGHLMFSASRYHQGFRPSIDVSLSVSRVGRQTQSLAQKSLADKIKALLAQASKLQSYARLGSEVSAETQFVLKQGSQIEAILKQAQLNRIPIPVQMVLLGLVFTPFFSQKDVDFVQRNKEVIVRYLTSSVFDFKGFAAAVSKLKSDKEFIQYLNFLIPNLGKICK